MRYTLNDLRWPLAPNFECSSINNMKRISCSLHKIFKFCQIDIKNKKDAKVPVNKFHSPLGLNKMFLHNRLQNKLMSLSNGKGDMTSGQIKRFLKDNN